MCVSFRPPVRPGSEDVVWQDIIVAKGGHNRYYKVFLWISIFSKYLPELADQQFIQVYHLLLGSRDLVVVIMAGRISCPDHEVDFVSKVMIDPGEGAICQRDWGVTICCLGSVEAGRTRAPVTDIVFGGRGVGFVERIGVEV